MMRRRRGVGLVGVAVVAHHASNKGAQQQAAADQQAAAAAEPTYAPEAAAPATSGGLTPESIDELTKLSDLQKAGVLTQEEFDAQKAKILAA
jgi:hypothetical protein